MKITVVHLGKPIGMSSSIDSKNFDFEVMELGIIATPRGTQSFSKKLRLIPWANIAGCDLAKEEAEQDPQLTVPAQVPEGVTAEDLERDPQPVTVATDAPVPERAGERADLIVFKKDEKTGVIRETKPFAKLRDAKATPAPE